MVLIELMRHGEPDVAGLLLGRTDRPLSQAGWRQVERQTSGRRFKRIISSPLERARAAAERLALGQDLEHVVDPDWSELDFGVWDGLPLKELQSEREAFNAIYESPDAPAPPGGESWRQLTERVGRALHAIAAGGVPTGPVLPTLVLTHAGPMRAALALTCDIPFQRLWAFRIAYGTRMSLRIGRDDGGRLWGEIVEIVQP